MKRTALLLIALAALRAGADDGAPRLRHVFDIHARCAEARNVGAIPGGLRVMIPITGGRTEGEVESVILPGGADYQLIDTAMGRVEFDAVYTLMTGDSCLINVRNRGISTSGEQGYYFTTSPSFEAPADSRYGWLNNRMFLCRPIGFGEGEVSLRVWVAE